MAEMRDPHPRNATGPFYVVNGECISCGAPESEAGGLMSHDDAGHCFFERQPVTEDETNAAIRGVWASCCGAVRYGGDDLQILVRLAELDLSSQCDRQLRESQPKTVRNRARFEYAAPHDGILSIRKSLRLIIKQIAESMRYPGSEPFDFRCWLNDTSFRVRWGKVGNGSGHTVRFSVTHESADWWLLRISENEVAHTAFAIRLDEALQQKAEFRSIHWFEENDWPTGGDHPKRHPY